VNDPIHDIEEALVGHWSHFGRWPKGALVEDGGTLRYETPIPHLPYNAVVRTGIADEEADEVISRVVASFRARDVDFAWWVTPSATPADLGARLEEQELRLVERATGMSLELDEWDGAPPREGVDYVEVVDDEGMAVYADLIYSYWETPEESRDLVAEVNSYWGPGKAPAHRWVAFADGRPVGKALLSLAAPDGVAAVYGMSVRPEARGRGVAGGLTSTLLQRARELGCHRVVLHSTEMATGVYARSGFVERCPLAVYASATLWSGRDH
jgi:GNAT superfamily N-acetyltransferase